MSRVDVLLNAKQSVVVKFLEFTRVVGGGGEKVAVFFEGEDEKYYSIRINSVIPGLSWGGINCGGKSTVVEVRDRIRNHDEYSKEACMFFVDSDFDDNSALSVFDDIYLTPCYSVENLYLSVDVFKRVLSSEFGLTEHGGESECFKTAVRAFEGTKSSYVEAISEFNYWIRSYRMMERAGGVPGRLNINNINFDDLVGVSIGSCVRHYDGDHVDALFPEVDASLSVDKSVSETHFSTLDRSLYFRGKQQLEFMRVFIGLIKLDRCKKNDRVVFKGKGNVKLNLTKGNCLSELAQYADTPACLYGFLGEFKAAGRLTA